MTKLGNILLHGNDAPQNVELVVKLLELGSKVHLTSPIEGCPATVMQGIAEDEIEMLIVCHPSNLELGTIPEAKAFLVKAFEIVQQFISARMKSKKGNILFLIDARANGLDYGTQDSAAPFVAAQGGFTGLAKTISKEYSKRGIVANAIYVDWRNPSYEAIVAQVASFAQSDLAVAGQIIAVDGGRWL